MLDPNLNSPVINGLPDVPLPLSRALSEARAAGYITEPTQYMRALRGAMAGVFPAEQAVNGRWWVRRSDLKAMADGIASMPTRRANPAPGRSLALATA